MSSGRRAPVSGDKLSSEVSFEIPIGDTRATGPGSGSFLYWHSISSSLGTSCPMTQCLLVSLRDTDPSGKTLEEWGRFATF
jgi:hypothetical protein